MDFIISSLCLALAAQSSTAVSLANEGIVGYIALAFGVLLSCGAVAWFLRSGTSLAMAKDTADKSYVISTDNVSRIVALETKQYNTEGNINSVNSHLASLVSKMESVNTSNNSEFNNLNTRVTQLESILAEIKIRLNPLEHISEWVALTRDIKEQLQDLKETVNQTYVPRNEIKARFDLVESRIDILDHKK